MKYELFLTGDSMIALTSEIRFITLILLILNDRNWNEENMKVCVLLFLLASPSHKKKL